MTILAKGSILFKMWNASVVVVFILFLCTFSHVDCVSIRGKRPVTRKELQELQGLPESFALPPPGWSMPTQNDVTPTEFDYNGIKGNRGCLGGSVFTENCALEDTNEAVLDQCAKSLCDPLCLRTTWECKFVSTTDEKSYVSFSKFVENEEYIKAMCAQIQAHACTELMSCCEKNDPFVYSWVDGMTTKEDGIHSLVPYPECDHDATNTALADLICASCKSKFKLESVQPIQNACDNLGDVPGGVPEYRPIPGSDGDTWKQNFPGGFPVKDMIKRLPQLPIWVPEFADGKRTSLRERCNAFQLKYKTSGMESKILGQWNPEKICQCAGCCDVPKGTPQCYIENAVTGAAFPSA